MNANQSNVAAPWATALANIGLLLVLTGACMPVARVMEAYGAVVWLKWVYAAGAACCLAGRIFTSRATVPNVRAKRLLRLEMWAAVVFCTGAFFLFWPGAGATDWLAFTLAGAIIQGYVSIALPRALRKG